MYKIKRKGYAGRGFSMVELLIVIVIIAILTGVILMGGTSDVTAEAFSEAGKLQNSLKALRSAWLASYADNFVMVGVPASGPHGLGSDVANTLARFSDRSLAEEVAKYGDIQIKTDSAAIYIGFAGPWAPKMIKDDVKSAMKRMIANSDIKFYTQSDSDEILIRIK